MSEDNTSDGAAAKRPRQSRTGLTSTGVRKAAAKSNRSRAREFALQALYQHLVGRNEAEAIDAFTRDLAGFHKADSAHYDALLEEAARQTDPNRRRALLEEAERTALADHPLMPLYFYVNKHLVKPSLRGWYDNVMNVIYSQDLAITGPPN